jgi:hypothetical protein
MDEPKLLGPGEELPLDQQDPVVDLNAKRSAEMTDEERAEFDRYLTTSHPEDSEPEGA